MQMNEFYVTCLVNYSKHQEIKKSGSFTPIRRLASSCRKRRREGPVAAAPKFLNTIQFDTISPDSISVPPVHSSNKSSHYDLSVNKESFLHLPTPLHQVKKARNPFKTSAGDSYECTESCLSTPQPIANKSFVLSDEADMLGSTTNGESFKDTIVKNDICFNRVTPRRKFSHSHFISHSLEPPFPVLPPQESSDSLIRHPLQDTNPSVIEPHNVPPSVPSSLPLSASKICCGMSSTNLDSNSDHSLMAITSEPSEHIQRNIIPTTTETEKCPFCRCENAKPNLMVSFTPPSSKNSFTSLGLAPSFKSSSLGVDNKVKDSALKETLTFMKYRAFQRWYRGAHERGWSRPAAALLCTLAGALLLFAYHTICSVYIVRREEALIHVGLIAFLVIILLLGKNKHFVPRWSVRVSLLYIAFSIVTLFSLVSYDISRTETWSQDQDPGDKTLCIKEPSPLSKNQCLGAENAAYSFYCAQLLVCILGFLYSFGLKRLAKYYYINTSCFISRWRIIRCQPVRLLVPGLGQTDKERYRELIRNLPLPLTLKGKATRKESKLQIEDVETTRLDSNSIQSVGPKLMSQQCSSAATTHKDCTETRHCNNILRSTKTTTLTNRTSSKALRRISSPTETFSVLKECDASKQDDKGSDEGTPRQEHSVRHQKQLQGRKPSLALSGVEEQRLRVSRGLRIECEAVSLSKNCARNCKCIFGCVRRRKPKNDPAESINKRKGCTHWWNRNANPNWADIVEQVTMKKKSQKKINKVTFIGEVDSIGRPEGFGFWKEDGNDYGERLVGYWTRGVPNGPYKSREFGSGSGFMCIRIGWGRYNLADDVLKFGVANVECSVSGKFYRGFPAVALLDPPEIGEKTKKDDSVFLHEKIHGNQHAWLSKNKNNREIHHRRQPESSPIAITPEKKSSSKNKLFSLTQDIPIKQTTQTEAETLQRSDTSQQLYSQNFDLVGSMPQQIHPFIKSTPVRLDTEDGMHSFFDGSKKPDCLQNSSGSTSQTNKPIFVQESIQGSTLFDASSIDKLSDVPETNMPAFTEFTQTTFPPRSIFISASEKRSRNNVPPIATHTNNPRSFLYLNTSITTTSPFPLINSATLPISNNILCSSYPVSEGEELPRESLPKADPVGMSHDRNDRPENTWKFRKPRFPLPFPRHAFLSKSHSIAVPAKDINWMDRRLHHPEHNNGIQRHGRRRKTSISGGTTKPGEEMKMLAVNTVRAWKKLGRGAMNVPQHIRAGKAAAAGAGAAVFRLLRKRDIEKFERMEKGRRDVAWCLAELSPHTPNFGIQPRSEMVISVDDERGLNIAGWLPKDSLQESHDELVFLDEIQQLEDEVVLDVGILAATSPSKVFSRTLKSIDARGAAQKVRHDLLNAAIENTKAQREQLNTNQPVSDTISALSNVYHGASSGSPITVKPAVRCYSCEIPETTGLNFDEVTAGTVEAPATADEGWNALKMSNVKNIQVELDREKAAEIVHHPLYRRPTIEATINQKDVHDLRINIVRRRLLRSDAESANDGTTSALPQIAYNSQTTPKLATYGENCSCSCHCHQHEVFMENSACVNGDLYGPDHQSQRLDAWGNRLGVEIPELEAEGWMCRDTAGTPEVLVYIHGYNNSHIESLQILGQMGAFGNYPNHIRLFLFSWPAGNGAFEFFKARSAAEDSKTHKALAHFLRAIRDNGIRQLHIMCHSMGSRLFLKSFREMAYALFQEVETDYSQEMSILNTQQIQTSTSSKFASAKLQLVSVTFLNPEYFLDEFIEEDYPRLRTFCNHITIFADAKDQALRWSETMSRRPALGKNVFGLWRPAGGLFSSTAILKQPPRFVNTVSFFRYNSYSGQKDNGGDGRDEEDNTIEWLDLDVIDTTFIDQNVHTIRHSFWNLNREIIEDIRDFMVTRKRARQRSGRLDRRDGNVWVYRVAPSFLTSIFDVYL